MSGAAITIEVKDRAVRELLARIQKHVNDLTPAMKIIGEIVRTSIVRNFEKSGRPDRWKPLSPVTLARRKGHKILMVQGLAGGLAGSIHWTAHSDRVSIGTNKVYGAVHQFGAKKGSFGTVEEHIKEHVRRITKVFGRPVKPHKITVGAHTRKVKLPWGDIPARPFLMVQPGDWEEIKAELAEYITA